MSLLDQKISTALAVENKDPLRIVRTKQENA